VIGWATCFQDIHRDVADYLLTHGAMPTLFSGIALDRADLVRRLVAGNHRLLGRQMSRFEHRRMPLHFAGAENKPEMVGLLLDLGADPGGQG